MNNDLDYIAGLDDGEAERIKADTHEAQDEQARKLPQILAVQKAMEVVELSVLDDKELEHIAYCYSTLASSYKVELERRLQSRKELEGVAF